MVQHRTGLPLRNQVWQLLHIIPRAQTFRYERSISLVFLHKHEGFLNRVLIKVLIVNTCRQLILFFKDTDQQFWRVERITGCM